MFHFFKNKKSSASSLPFMTTSSEIKKLTASVVNFVAQHRDTQRDASIGTSKHTSELSALREALPQMGTSMENILSVLKNEVYAHDLNEGHPRFFDYIPVAPNPVSVLSHLISAGVNPFVGSWGGFWINRT